MAISALSYNNWLNRGVRMGRATGKALQRGQMMGRGARSFAGAHRVGVGVGAATVGIASGGAMWARHRANNQFNSNPSYNSPYGYY